MRIPKAQLEKLATSEDVQKQLGLERERGEREILWKARLASSEHMINQAKLHATYWLGLAQYDTGKLDAAVESFERRTIAGSPGTPWTPGASYNLGPTYEAQNNLEAAARWYEADDTSPQGQGNRFRARWLKQPALPCPCDDYRAGFVNIIQRLRVLPRLRVLALHQNWQDCSVCHGLERNGITLQARLPTVPGRVEVRKASIRNWERKRSSHGFPPWYLSPS